MIDQIYRVCRSYAAPDIWTHIKKTWGSALESGEVPDFTAHEPVLLSLPPFLPELARLEWASHEVRHSEIPSSDESRQVSVNPALHLFRFSWKNLARLLGTGGNGDAGEDEIVPCPEPGEEWVLVWRHPATGKATAQPASNEDLLALKLIAEGNGEEMEAMEGLASIYFLHAVIDRAVKKGLLLAPPSRIRRDSSSFPLEKCAGESVISSSVFTLQWHITQACELHCKHCYDRADRSALALSRAVAVLDDLYGFCRERYVRGQVSFTGGNPFLYPDFMELYRAASKRGFGLAILGNPVARKQIEDVVAIEPPLFYQLSLEGLPEYNDEIRGSGHFKRVVDFLGVLRSLGVYSMVMLTLGKDNMAQVLPLAEMLRDSTDLFTFNRLSLVGEGARLRLPSKDDYAAFLHSYTEAADDNPIIGLKDNLINVVRSNKGLEVFGGCTGFGCGAAFNFLSVLSDGEVHACRKFPSPVGNLLQNRIGEIYDSEAARSYRAGSRACRACTLKPVCGGCLAIAHSFGLDIFEERDPYCFING